MDYPSVMGILLYCCDVNNLKCKEVVKMTREELQCIIAGEPYDFLRTNPHLGKHLMFLTIGGSHAYGTNVEGSNVDIRGIALNSREDLLGLGTFEHWVDETTDTTVFGFKKAIELMCSGNPNILEQLGNADDLIISYHPATKLLMENKKLFLSRQVVYSFGSFADKMFNEAVKYGEFYNQMQKFGSVCDLFNVKCKMNKTIMNMIRLYLMVFDILEKGEIITNRAAAHELLMEARSGGFQNENGYISHELKNLQKEYEKRLQYDRANTMLPERVNMKQIEELVMTINEMALKVA
jgi:predicted nucleotidyltransferase